jgi:hypothetical protein
MSSVISFEVIKKQLQQTEGSTLVDLMQQALDFHYESGRDKEGRPVKADFFLFEDVFEVMKDAEATGDNKIAAVKAYLEELLVPYADEINRLYGTTQR